MAPTPPLLRDMTSNINLVTYDSSNELDIWDATALTRMMGDNPVMQRRLLEKFLIRAQEQVDALLNAAATGDAATVGSAAHSLKSAARTVGAMQLGELCLEMEKAGKTGDKSTYKTLAERLHETLAAAAEKIKQHLS